MVKTASNMVNLGTIAPDFILPDVVSGQSISLDTFRDKKALVIMFICQHCPFVQHIQGELTQLGKDYRHQSVGLVAISANDANDYPADSPRNLKEMAQKLGFEFSLCYDETQETAKAYQAACTPDFYVFNEYRQLIYRGQLDDSRPGSSIPVTGHDLRSAIDAVLHDQAAKEQQKPSIGCNIKWRTGNEPSYFKG